MEQDIILSVKNLNQWFVTRNPSANRNKIRNTPINYTQRLRDISFNVKRGEVFGIVGESGCGKSTLAKCLSNLYGMYTGEVIFEGKGTNNLSGQELKDIRKKIQVIFQNPRSALSSHMPVEKLIKEAVELVVVDKTKVSEKVDLILKDINLEDERRRECPHKLSGGERRRAGLGRVLAINPSLIIADEPVASLDVSYKGKIIKLLMNYKKRANATIIFISHDINLVNKICDRVMVMFLGKIVEIFHPTHFKTQRHHPYTQELFYAASFFGGENENDIEFVPSSFVDAESLTYNGVGCCYQKRCHKRNEFDNNINTCEKCVPHLQKTENGQEVACFYINTAERTI